MGFVAEIVVFVFCICFSVCGVLWTYGDVATSGILGLRGILFTVLFSILIPAVALAIGVLFLDLETNLFSLIVPWAIGLAVGIAVRLLTRRGNIAAAG
jgi:hypothetical protein